MKIGIDLDNVLNDLSKKWLLLYTLKNNHIVTIEDIKCWGMHKYVKIGKGIYDYLQPDLFKETSPLPYSQEVTERLAKDHELFIVTATEPRNLEVKVEWLKKFYPHINQHNIISTMRKDLVNVDLLIDDAPHNIKDFPRDTIVLDYAWNRSLDSSFTRAYDWLDIEDIILNNKFKQNC